MILIYWLVFGALVGWIASLITGRRRSALTNVLVGIAGSGLGGLISWLLLGSGNSLFMSLLVASIFLLILNWYSSEQQPPKLTPQVREPILDQRDSTKRSAFGRGLGYVEIVAIILTILVAILTLLRGV